MYIGKPDGTAEAATRSLDDNLLISQSHHSGLVKSSSLFVTLLLLHSKEFCGYSNFLQGKITTTL
jgi:hypothetical protein